MRARESKRNIWSWLRYEISVGVPAYTRPCELSPATDDFGDSRLVAGGVRIAARSTSITCSSSRAVVSGAGAMAYPPPPDFYKLYAPRPDDPEAASRWTPPPAPPPPVKGAYTVFGASHTVRRDLRPRFRVRVRNVVSSPLTRRACPRADRDDRTPLRAEQTVPSRGRGRRCVPRPRAPNHPLVSSSPKTGTSSFPRSRVPLPSQTFARSSRD